MRKISWEERKAVIERSFADEGKGYKLVGLVGEFKGNTSRVAYECPDHGRVEGRLGDMIKATVVLSALVEQRLTGLSARRW